MNAIVRRSSAAPLPEPSASLAAALEGGERVVRPILPDDAPRLVPLHPPTAADVAEGRRLLPAYEAAMRPPTADVVRPWLLRLAGAVRQPPSAEEVATRAGLLAEAAEGLPALLFGPETLREAMRRWEWWPSVADVVALLAPLAAPHRLRLSRLRRLAGVTDAAEASDPLAGPQNGRAGHVGSAADLTPEQRAEMAARLRALSAELRGRSGEAPPPPPPRAAPLSDAALAEMRDRSPLVQRARAADLP